MNDYMFAAIIGSLLSGGIVGAIPAICGGVKGKLGLGLGGFAACLVASFILGLLLSVPVCAVFMFLIFRKPKQPVETFIPSGSYNEPAKNAIEPNIPSAEEEK